MSDKGPAQLHQLLAAEKGLGVIFNAALTEAKGTFGKVERFTGLTRVLKMHDDDRKKEEAAGSSHSVVTTTVDEKLEYMFERIGSYVDAVVQKEASCQGANSDLIVNGVVVGSNIPATGYLAIERQLNQLKDVLVAIPTLKPGVEWTDATGERPGLYRTAPSATNKTEKVLIPVVLSPATDKHPAQVKESTKDVVVGVYNDIETSGMWTTARKAEVLSRLDSLILAVRDARARANCAPVKDIHIAKNIQSFLLTGKIA
jgi:hypothetical protein